MGVKRPSFLKKLKEERRKSKAAEKREARRARQIAKASRGSDSESPEEFLATPDELQDLSVIPAQEGDRDFRS